MPHFAHFVDVTETTTTQLARFTDRELAAELFARCDSGAIVLWKQNKPKNICTKYVHGDYVPVAALLEDAKMSIEREIRRQEKEDCVPVGEIMKE